MKHLIKTSCFALGLMMAFSFSSPAQASYTIFSMPQSQLSSEQGYWVVVSNNETPLQHTVYFYTNENVLVYKEKVSGITMDTEKRKVKRQLKNLLNSRMQQWNKAMVLEENKGYVYNMMAPGIESEFTDINNII